MYMCMTGQILEESLAKLPPDRPFSGPVVRLVERSLKKASPDQVLSQIEAYEKRKNSPGLLSRLFGGDNRRPREEKREEKREVNLRLPPRKAARPDASDVKGKPVLGERIKTKKPSGFSEAPPVASEPQKGKPFESDLRFPGDRKPFSPVKRPDTERLEEPEETALAKESETTEGIVPEQTVSPQAEGKREAEPKPEPEVPKVEVAPPSAEIDRMDGSLPAEMTEKPAEEAPRDFDVQAPEPEEAAEKEEEAPGIPERSPSREETSPEATDLQPPEVHQPPAASRPSAAEGQLPPDRTRSMEPSDDQTRRKQEQEQMDHLIRERLIRERKEHDRLASQFREYANMIQSGGGNP